MIKVKTPAGVRGIGVFQRGMGMTSVETFSTKALKNGQTMDRELFFTTAGQHTQTNLITKKGSVETTRVFRGAKWKRTTVRYDSGKSVNYTPRTGSRPRPGPF